jgi:transposase InsO family protein
VGYPAHKTTLIRRLAREGARRSEGKAGGGQRGFVYDVATLPAPLRAALAPPESPLATYARLPKDRRAEVDARCAMMREVRAHLDEGRSLNTACRAVGEGYEVSQSTVKALWRMVRDVPEADWPGLLVKRYKGSEPGDVPPVMLAEWVRDYYRPEKPAARAVYGRLCRKAEAEGWGPVPNIKTMMRHGRRLASAAVRILRTEGVEGLKQSLPHAERDRSDIRVMEGWCGDHRDYDVLVRFPDGTEGRPSEYKIIDEASGYCVGYVVARSAHDGESTDLICAALYSAAETHGLPFGWFRTDRATAAKSAAMTELVARLGFPKRQTLPYNGRSKLVERAFGDIKERCEKHPDAAGAYLGKDTVSKPAYSGPAEPIPYETWLRIRAEAHEEYNTRTGRESRVAWGTSFQAVFEAGRAETKVRIATSEQLRMFFLRPVERTVAKDGSVTLGKRPYQNRYHSEALLDRRGKRVRVFYDYRDLRCPVRVEDLDGREIAAEVPMVEKCGFNSSEDTRRHMRATRDGIRHTKALNKALDEQAAALLGQPPVTGQATPVAPAPVVAPVAFEERARPQPAPRTDAPDDPEWLAKVTRGRDRLREDWFGDLRTG